VITKKITKEMEEKLLKIIYERYTREYGYGTLCGFRFAI